MDMISFKYFFEFCTTIEKDRMRRKTEIQPKKRSPQHATIDVILEVGFYVLFVIIFL